MSKRTLTDPLTDIAEMDIADEEGRRSSEIAKLFGVSANTIRRVPAEVKTLDA